MFIEKALWKKKGTNYLIKSVKVWRILHENLEQWDWWDDWNRSHSVLCFGQEDIEERQWTSSTHTRVVSLWQDLLWVPTPNPHGRIGTINGPRSDETRHANKHATHPIPTPTHFCVCIHARLCIQAHSCVASCLISSSLPTWDPHHIVSLSTK